MRSAGRVSRLCQPHGGWRIKIGTSFIILFTFFLSLCMTAVAARASATKKRIFIVSSYHKGYWQSAHEGLAKAMLKYGYLDGPEQGDAFVIRDQVEGSKVVIKKEWMDAKRKDSLHELGKATQRIMRAINDFSPDLVLLGDEEAANYIGNQLLDTKIPVVFWGINGLPLKYGLVDSMDRPGHNITGVWQTGFYGESLEFLSKLVPEAKTFAILGGDSVTTRPGIKKLHALAKQGKLPLQLKDTVVTNSFAVFKKRALELSQHVDAFFVFNHDTLKDEADNYVDMSTVSQWYLQNIKKPEASNLGQLVREGMLLTVDDSGYNQAFQAFEMAYDILEQGLNPARIRTKTPSRGPFMVNRIRAQTLGISLGNSLHLIEELVDSTPAIER